MRSGRMLIAVAALAALAAGGCGTPERRASKAAPLDSAVGVARGGVADARSSDTAGVVRGDTAGTDRGDTTRVLPPVGLAIPDSGRVWCATFEYHVLAHDGLAPGARVKLVFPMPGVDSASYDARVRRERRAPCSTGFGAVAWGDGSMRAYDLEATGAEPPAPDGGLTAAIVVASDAKWTRAADGTERADLDGDGIPEEARTCLGGEGRRFTIRSANAPAGEPRWWAYFDLGALVEETCDSTAASGS
ncbi:MAG TPA: hypothetical protein VF041_18515 [Gemmatimonadaceae bacterium]